MIQLKNSQALQLSVKKPDLCYKEGQCLLLIQGKEVGRKSTQRKLLTGESKEELTETDSLILA